MTEPRGPGRFSRPVVRLGLPLLVLVLAFALPRVIALRGIEYTSPLSFIDMAEHLYNLDLVTKRATLSDDQLADPYFRHEPGALVPRFTQKWPMGTYYAALPWAWAFGPLSVWTTLLTNLSFTVVLLLGLVGLGRALGSLQAGLWGGVLAVLCPALLASTWYFSLDYPVTAMVVMGLYLLWRTDRFSRPLATLALCLWSALGVFIKPTYPLYLVVPAAVALVLGLRSGPRLRVAATASGGLLLASVLSFFALGVPWAKLWEQVTDHSVLTLLPGSAIDPWTAQWALAQVRFAAYNFPWPLLLLALPGLVLLHVPSAHPRRAAPARWLLLSALWGSYAVLTLMINKGERYVQPLYPLVCLVTAHWILAWLPRVVRRVALGLTVAGYLAVIVAAHGYPTPWLPELELEAPWACKPGSPTACLPWRNNAAHPFWYEQTMPGRMHLTHLGSGKLDIFCSFRPVVEQVAAWSRALPDDRPLGVAYLRDPRHEHGELPYPWLVALSSQWIRDRFVLAPGVAGLPVIPRWILDLPHLIIVHVPQVDPTRVHSEIRITSSKTFTMQCGPGTVDLTLSLAEPVDPPWV